MGDPLENAKTELREAARRRRRSAHAASGAAAAERVRAHFIAALAAMGIEPAGKGRSPVIAGYWPIGEELDVRLLLAELHGRGFACALPVVVARRRPLVFRRWRPETVLKPAAFGIEEPGPDEPELTPSLVIAPLLAFDIGGHRLGHGAGYYDSTLAELRRRGSVVAVGVGFAAQAVAELPATERDQKLDWMVTEERAWRMPP